MKTKQILTVLAAIAALLGVTINVQAAAKVASVTGDWGNTATWGGAAVPVAGDTVTINTGINVTGLGGANRACASIVIQGTGSLTVDANTLTLTSTVTVGSSGGPATLTIASGATMTGITTLSFAGTTPTVANNGTLSLSTFGSGGTLTQGVNANLTLTQANGVAPAGTLVATASGNTVTYSGSGPAVKVTTYHNLTFSFAGTGSSYAWNNSIVVNGTLTAGGNAANAINNVQGTFGAIVQNGAKITCNAATTVSGNLTVTSGVFYEQTGGLIVTGTTTVNGGMLQLGSTAAFTGDYTLSSGTNNNTGNGTVSFAGNLTASGGTFTSGTGVHTFSGAGKTITGPVAIQKVTVTGTYAVSGTLTVSTALGLTSGGLTGANNIALGNGATITRDTGTLDVAPTFGTTVNVAYTGSTAATTGPEIPTSTTALSALAINNTSAGGITLGVNITANGAVTLATGTKLNVPTTMEIKSTLAMTGTGLLAVSNGGVLKNSGSSTITSSATTLTFASGAKFQHAVASTTGTVPTAGWNANSTLEIMNTSAIGGTPPSGLAQSFGNVTWDNTQSSGCNLVGVNLNSIAGTFTVKNTGSFELRLGSTQSPTENWGNLVLQGGTLVTSSSSGVPTINVAGSVTFSGGALTIVNAAPLNVGGNWTKNSGTFTPGTGTVTFNGISAQIIGGSATTAFNGLTLNNSAGASLGQTETVNGTLTLTTGALSSAGNLTIGSGGTISRNTGTLDAAPSFGTTANVTYTGASAVNTGYEIPASSTVLSNLTVNKSGGVTVTASTTVNGTLTLTSGSFDVGANTLTLNGPTIAGTAANLNTTSSSSLVFGGGSTGVNVPSSVASLSGLTINNTNGVTLNSSPTVAGTLTLTSGKVNAGANTLSVSSAGTISGGSSGSYVNGTLQKAFNTGSGQSFSFPIGDAAVYAPVALTNLDVTGADTLTATTTASQHPQIATSGIDPTNDVQRYWTLTPGGGLTVSTYDATFNFVAGDVIGGANPATFIVQRYSGGTWSTATIGTLTSTNSQATGLSLFGDFAVGEVPPTPTSVSVSSSANPVGFLDNVTFIATLTPSVAPGAVQFKTNGVSFGSPITLAADGKATNSTASLPRGTIAITAEYPGNVNYGASTGTLSPAQTVTNHPPVAHNLTLGVAHGGSVSLQVIGGKNAPSDADGDNMTIAAVGAASSGTSGNSLSNVTYTADGAAGTNTFTYSVSDDAGGTDTKTVTVVVTDPQGFNQVSAINLGGNTLALSYLGIPGTNYALDWATNLGAPIDWMPVVTNTAQTNGWLYFTNTGIGTDFYRTRYVP